MILTWNIFIFRPLWSYLEIFLSLDHYFLPWNTPSLTHCVLNLKYTHHTRALWTYKKSLAHCDLTLKYSRPWPTVILPWNILIFRPLFLTLKYTHHTRALWTYKHPWPTVILPWNIFIFRPLWSYLEISSSLANCDLTLKYPPPWPAVILPWNILLLGPLWSYLEISSSLAHCAEMIRLSSVSGWTKPLYAAPHISWTKKELSLESILNFENTMTFRFSKYTILGY